MVWGKFFPYTGVGKGRKGGKEAGEKRGRRESAGEKQEADLYTIIQGFTGGGKGRKGEDEGYRYEGSYTII